MTDFPEGTVLIEVRGLYDGWSVARLPDGSLVNRWPEGDHRHAETQDWIERMNAAAVAPVGVGE